MAKILRLGRTEYVNDVSESELRRNEYYIIEQSGLHAHNVLFMLDKHRITHVNGKRYFVTLTDNPLGGGGILDIQGFVDKKVGIALHRILLDGTGTQNSIILSEEETSSGHHRRFGYLSPLFQLLERRVNKLHRMILGRKNVGVSVTIGSYVM